MLWGAVALAGVVIGALGVAAAMGALSGGDRSVPIAAPAPSEPASPAAEPPAAEPPAAEPPAAEPPAADRRAERPEVGDVALLVQPEGARVFQMLDGPDHRFAGLSTDGEVMVLVTAPGHIPRTRLVSPAEFGTPLVLDLEPAGTDAVAFPFDVQAPRAGGGARTASLLVSSNTPHARLGIMVGEAPRVTLGGVDTDRPHHFLVVHPDFSPREVVVGVDQWAATDGSFNATTTVSLADRDGGARG